ncbi:sugar ABC transporter permease [Herbiconiux sp. VKM Ac-1786]|jgi:multiple sugar transport system permease protein|uniref:carbohydrate ABC transporter permease n=1 Tax=Herbiconiux sp. VKM Ac-1786 TaxID=2783824 RepID=UPI00188A1AB8|nr:sugar ABC transporter permease [Herbiconiux sp. VKM Ac-1786]MBF4572405.1 sugar ABC transporter permease [Herbiconiux sp. VKM Ac-1786]
MAVTVASGSKAPARPRRRPVISSGWAFVIPFLIFFAIAILAPVVYAIYLSLFRDQLVGGSSFVGLANYAQALTDPDFWFGVGRVFGFMIIQVPIMLVFSLIAALAIDSGRLRAPGFYRILLFLPYAVPGVVAVLIWGFIYGPRFGLVGSINSFLGAQIFTPLTPEWVLGSIANIAVWEFAGYNMVIFYAALRTVPNELYEAASLDGAGAFRTILSIKLPALRGALVITTIFSIIGSFQLFNEPNLLKPIAPNAITSTFTPNLYAYNLAFTGQQYNYSATIAIVMGLITAVIAYVVQLRGTRKELR